MKKNFFNLLIVLTFGLVGCNIPSHNYLYLEEINIQPIFNSYGKQNFLEHHKDISFDNIIVYIFKTIDDISQMVNSSAYYENLTEVQIVEFKKVLENNYIIFVPIVLSSSAEFKCKMILENDYTNLTFLIGPFGQTEEFFIEKYTAIIPQDCVDEKNVNYKFEIIY